MKDKIILTVDIGTQSTRVSFINSKGEILALQQVKYRPPYFSKLPGFAEIDPDDYIKYIGEGYRELIKKFPQGHEEAIGLAVTVFRDSTVMTKKDMVPLRPAILWLDQRSASGKEKFPLWKKALFKLVGAYDIVNLNRVRTHAQWVKEYEPDIWKQVERYMNVSTYINYKLTGNFNDSDANIIGHLPADYPNRKWLKNNNDLVGSIYGVDVHMLCDLVPAGGILGQVTKEASEATGIKEGLTVYAIGSDKGCETLGVGAFDNTVGAVSFGTSATIQVTNKKFVRPGPLMPAYPAIIDGYFNTETMVNKGYWMLGWFAREFAQKDIEIAKSQGKSVEELLNESLKTVRPGSEGLMLSPLWGPTLKKPLALGSITGFGENHKKEHFYRAIIEGINYELKEGLLTIEKNQKQKLTSLMVSGGGSQCDEICQITADIFGLPVSRTQTNETTSIGAALAGFLAAKVFEKPEDAVKAMVHVTKTFEPIKENVELYKYYFAEFEKIYPANKKNLATIKIHEEIIDKESRK